MIPAAIRGPRARRAGALFLVLSVAYTASIGLRASRGAAITGDEPFYLLTTQSLLRDGDLDLTNQYASRSYREFFDHPDGLWRQSVPREDGVLLSPHDPGLSVLLLPGFALGGLVGAQVEVLLLTALAFALAFVLVDSVTGRTRLAWWSTLGVGLAATSFVYATEIYPEAPAALALVAALVLALGPRPDAWRAAGIVLACSAIPWLGVKYAPLAVIVAGVGLVRASGAGRALIAGLGLVSGLLYVWFQVETFGGLTPYGLNTVYAGGSTAEIVADHVDVADRLYRIWGLFIDRRFGIGRWAPLLLLVVPGIPALVRGGRGERLVAILVGAQLAIGTFVAITMMGWWFPGRTMMTVFPLLTLPIAAFVRRAGRAGTWVAIGLGLWTVAITTSLAIAGHAGEVVMAVDPFELGALPFRAVAGAFPSYTSFTAATYALTAAWLAAAGLVVVWVARRAPRLDAPRSSIAGGPVPGPRPIRAPA